MVLCEHCLQAIKSRGERVKTELFYVDIEDGVICEWCEEEIEGEAYETEFVD